MVKKSFNCAYKFAINDFKSLIRILIDLIDPLLIYITAREIIGNEKPFKIALAAYLLK